VKVTNGVNCWRSCNIKSGMRDENVKIRQRAVAMLQKLVNAMQDPFPVVSTMLELLQDPGSSVRTRAASILGALSDLRAVEPLIQALKDGSYSVQRSAEEALRALVSHLEEPAPAIPMLLDALSNENENYPRM
jgi:HEAT repeat protein